MKRARPLLTPGLVLLSFLLLYPACEKTVEEDVIKPVEMMVGQKSAAAVQAALSNVQTVREALMRYPATSPSNRYPGEAQIYDYGTLRGVLAGQNLPADMADLMWDPAYGIVYRSDGHTFTFEVRALSGERETITATPEGVTRSP